MAAIIPLKVDAFVFNSAVCGTGNPDEDAKLAKIAPITQPNYTFLRLDNAVIQNDIQSHTDIHHTTPATANTRFTDLGRNIPRTNRHGVYVHWIIPRAYRSGIASTEKTRNPNEHREKKGMPALSGDDDITDHTAPTYPIAPARWLVIRRIDPSTVKPVEAQGAVPEIDAWVVESDQKRMIDDMDEYVDLQVDVSPFVDPTATNDNDDIDINQQAEVFIGCKTAAKDWNEDLTLPRVQLSLLNSSNQLFADYQPHNSNVFSIVDNFGYGDVDDDGEQEHLTEVTASYYVIGWHSEAKNDLLNLGDSGMTREARLAALAMAMKNPSSDGIGEWLSSTESTRLLCSGAMYDVKWSSTTKPANVAADKFSLLLNDELPVAVGTTPLDSLLAYVKAHKDSAQGKVHDLEEDLIRLQVLLQAQDDGVESQRQAADMLYNWNYKRVSGGTRFFIAGKDEKTSPTEPVEADIKKLKAMNVDQFKIDLIERQVQVLQWDMFSSWWRFVSDPSSKTSAQKELYKKEAETLTTRIGALRSAVDKVKSGMQVMELATEGTQAAFYQQRDPTVVVGGVESGWPYDYLDPLQIRVDSQVILTDAEGKGAPEAANDLLKNVIPKLPKELQDSASKLFKEFFALSDASEKDREGDGVYPQYHDKGFTPPEIDTDPPPRLWRDRWENTQPWFPLFMEWEAEYTHIPYELWNLKEQTARLSQGKLLRYGIDQDLQNIKDKDGNPVIIDHEDTRSISGRVLILPQPSFSLQAKIDQLLSSTPEDVLDKVLDKKKREELQKLLYKLAFLSAPLAGLTDHLTTRSQGSHIKPNKRPPGEKPQPMAAAIDAGKDGGFLNQQLELIDAESDLTPYGISVRFADEKHSPFKPVTHGQFKFTKMNIIDKFGQVIHAIDPTPTKDGPPPLYPVISDFYEPQTIDGTDDHPNTVHPQKPGHCEFMQLPPQINQLARLNAAFVTLETKGDNEVGKIAEVPEPHWRPVTEWENPIWGWIVVNYADHGLQIFLPDGTFYREVRVGGPLGALPSEKWLPFNPTPNRLSKESEDPARMQLDRLIYKLEDKDYLQAFVDMINGAMESSPPAPTAYAQFMNSVVGRPLALANAGWSLELATDAYTNQSSLNKTEPDRNLLPVEKKPGDTEDPPVYSFQVKLGDREREYDGLVGYFDTLKHPDTGNGLNLETILTFFSETSADPNKNPLLEIGDTNYPRLNPFWLKPESQSSWDLYAEWNKELKIFGCLIDPFSPIHAYSSFLPTNALELPTWTWQKALNKMTAFFHMGPMLLTENVPAYDKEYLLTTDYDLTGGQKVMTDAPVALPAIGIAEWNWLQPYRDEGDNEVYMPLSLKKLDMRPKFEKAPYTAVEGYLQMKAPIATPGT